MYLNTLSGVVVNEYLYSTAGLAFDTATVAASAVSADTDGTKYLQKGTVLATLTSGADSGLVGPYDTGASDGRETAANIVGINDTFAVLTDGNAAVGLLYKGTVKEANVYADGASVVGDVSNTVKSALQTTSIDILFR